MAGSNSKNEYSRSTPKSKGKNEGHDTPSRMDSPISGNPAQRKNQVQKIASNVFNDDRMEHVHPDDPDDLEDANIQPEIAHQGVTNQAPSHSTTHHVHTVHDRQSGESTTHKMPHGQDCPACGSDYMNAPRGD